MWSGLPEKQEELSFFQSSRLTPSLLSAFLDTVMDKTLFWLPEPEQKFGAQLAARVDEVAVNSARRGLKSVFRHH